jgi:alcohol dehydrogenase (cytochrome c)
MGESGSMKNFLWVLVLAAALPAWGAGPADADLKNDAGTPGDITTYGMGYGLQRHSPLKQVHRGNVRRLVPVWNLSLSNNYPQETNPLVIDGVMYATTTDATVAVDAVSGKQLWKTPITLPQDVHAVVCCGSHNRGAAAYQGRLFRGTLDGFVVALDMQTGKELWRQQAADYKDGYSMTGAPLIAGGLVLTGISGAELGTRGFIDAWDPATGQHAWRRFTTAGPGEPGGDTWAGDNYLHGGGSTWLTGSYDPDLDLVFWGVGNGGPWNPSLRNAGDKPYDNLYICSVIAIRPKTGEIVWHYQFSPNDPYDYDGTNELILAELPYAGVPRKVIVQANRNGFLYVLDRATGALLAANPFVDKITWAKGVDLKTGRPIDSEQTLQVRQTPEMATPLEIWPSALGGKNWSPMSYDPHTRLLYANTLNFGYPYRTEKQERARGQWYTGVDLNGWTWPQDGNRGYLRAIDPLTGKSKWKVGFPIPNFGGVLTTDGGLVFTGTMTGEFMAFDEASGRKLWQFQTGSGIVGLPVTWERNGRQYITVASGIGGAYTLFGGDERLKNVPTGGSLWTFALYDVK